MGLGLQTQGRSRGNRGVNAKKKIGIMATPPAAANITTFKAVMTMELAGRADKTKPPVRSTTLSAAASAMINPRRLRRWRGCF